jgi:hydroxylamine reductase
LGSRDCAFKTVKKECEKLSELNLKMYDKIYKKAVETFGNPKLVTVNTSTYKGKSILMTGTSLLELKNLLEATNGKNLDVYTNGNLLVAHSFPYFKTYEHLKGHFANSTENTILDFATFPGSVVLAKWEYQNIGNFYQGKFFSTNNFLPNGICHTELNFKEAIENSISNTGFVNENKREPIVTGVDYLELEKKLEIIRKKLNSGELENVIFIGLGTLMNDQKIYFEKLFKLINKKTYVISFSHALDEDNFLSINVANNYPLLLNVLKFIFKKLPPSDERMHFFVLRCDPNSMSTVISLMLSGVKNMFYWNCPPATVNPSVIKVFRKAYGLLETSTPDVDYKLCMK